VFCVHVYVFYHLIYYLLYTIVSMILAVYVNVCLSCVFIINLLTYISK